MRMFPFPRVRSKDVLLTVCRALKVNDNTLTSVIPLYYSKLTALT